MSNDLNQCNFIGRLGADPESRFLPSGDAVCNFRIAVGWKTKEKEGTEWVPVNTFGKLAEICGQYLKKGSRVFISGNFATRKWTDKDGQERYSTEIRANQMQMLDTRAQGQDSGQQSTRAPVPSGGGMDEDIPFSPVSYYAI